MELLKLCWLVTDGICSKRLAPFLPELLDRLRRRQALREFPIAVRARVAGMSAATLDRALKPLREQTKAQRGISTTEAGTLLKRQMPIRTFADWTEARPGFFEMEPGGALRLEWRRPVPVPAEHGRCRHRLGGLRPGCATSARRPCFMPCRAYAVIGAAQLRRTHDVHLLLKDLLELRRKHAH